ncbi:MAG: histidinol-phosphate transaminase [Thermodesulfovibrionales bacterium]|nr:histidinol-phosphate transaminase [Thermodesulfovibrionales bacterium]
MVKPPRYVSAIQPYVPGKPVEELERELGIRDSVKLASNENPLGPSPLVLKEIINDLTNTKSSLSLNRYPDGNGYYLKQALSRRLSVSEDEIILGNGSNELIDIAARTFLQPGDEAVMAHPSFVVYPMATQAQGATAIQIPLKKYTHNLDAMADAITSSTKIVFIANPNNPTGTMNTKAEFERFMKRVPEGILVVCDEAYCEYVTKPDYPDSMKYLAQGKDILILRTFSKMYGLAGLRIGYGIGRKDIIGEMNKLRPPFNTSSIAQKAALWALQDENHLQRTREINEQGKTYLYKELDSIGMKYVPTEANFIFMPLEHDAHTLYTILLKQGVIVRPMGQHEIRVTIGLPEENKRFIDALKKVMG